MLNNNGVTPKLPSGQQMTHMQLPPVMQEQIQAIALQVLQRLLSPLLRRHRLRKARLLLLHQYLANHVSAGEVEAAAVSALQHVSFLGAVIRDVHTATNATGADGAGAAARSPTSTYDGFAPTTASPTASVSSPVANSAAAAEIREQVRSAMASNLVHLSVYLQEELVEWEWEPASEVLVLLAGAVERRGAAVAVSQAVPASPLSLGHGGGGGGGSAPGTRRQSAVAAHIPSHKGSLSYGRPVGGSRRGSASMQSITSTTTTRSFPRRASSGAGAEGLFPAAGGGAGRAHTSAPMLQGAGGALMGDADVRQLAAPQVFGELACLGGFPYCASLSVTSPTAILLRISKEVYCKMVSEAVPLDGRRRLLVEALQMRERLMPYYAPLTPPRLLLCPLLTHLRPEQLEHIRDLAIPRVYAAGMECWEKGNPRHIFFIRRGVVQMQRDSGVSGGGAAGMGGAGAGAGLSARSAAASEFSSQQTAAAMSRASYSLELPKNRSILVEGHTYGETGCIFGDSLGDRYTAVTHVDMYLLPFQVLIQLMKQVPQVQSTVYRSAQELSLLRDKEWRGVLFGPRQFGVELSNVHGLVPTQGTLAVMAAPPATQNTEWQSMSSRNKRSSSTRPDPFGRPIGGGGNGGDTRRVTVFEDVPNSARGTAGMDERTGGGLTGGRVSSALLTAMEQLPVISLLPTCTADFVKACTQQWQCITYSKGDVIASAGQECSRLFLFFEGRAGVVHNAALLREELQPGPFGVADISSVGAAAICPIPAGHVVGYTCVRRHRWTHSIVAVDDVVEVWEICRSVFVQLLRTHGMEREMQAVSLQLLQPLAVQKDRLAVLDYQPLLHPMPNSLWQQQAVPNVHPVVTKEGAACFPVWREGDFPLDRRASLSDKSVQRGSVGDRRSTLNAVTTVKVAAIVNERQRSMSQRGVDSPKLVSHPSASAAAMSDSDSGARTNFIARLTSAAGDI